jgi:hypothetical protein
VVVVAVSEALGLANAIQEKASVMRFMPAASGRVDATLDRTVALD